MCPIVRIRDLSRQFGTRWALRDISLDVEPGQVHVVLGHNGAGKTTLFRVLMGLIRPTHGRAEIAGHDTWNADDGRRARAHVGVLFEEDGLYGAFSAWENLELMARIYRIPDDRWKPHAQELLAAVGLASISTEGVLAPEIIPI
jgi:ABC-type multidrug transport system ATPase subunit